MANFFILVFFISFGSLIVGLIKPSLFKKMTNNIPNRKKVFLIFGSIVFVSFICIGIFASSVEKKNNENIVVDTNKPQDVLIDKVVAESTTTEKTTATSTKPIVVETQKEEVVKILEDVNTQKDTTNNSIVQSTTSESQYQYYSVSSVVDGDTVKVSIGGTITTLRLIGIDTPETVDPRKPVQCFGKEASTKAKELLNGKKVRIEKDVTQGELDKYGRLLAYIYREDGLFYNKYMIEQGYAHEYTYNTPYKYQTEFKAAQKSAQDNLRGLWSPDTCSGDTDQSITTTVSEGSSSQTPAVTDSQTGKYYTSSYYSSKYYYPEACSGWQSLSSKYLVSFNSLEELLKKYPTKTLSSQCQ